MKEENKKILKPSEHIRRILKLPSQDFMSIEYESDEIRILNR